MRKTVKKIIWCMCISAVFVCALGNSVSATEDRIVAIVNKDIITQSHVDGFVNIMRIQLAAEVPAEELESQVASLQEEVLSRLIEDKLIIQEAKRQEIEADPELVRARFEQLKEGFESDVQFNETLLAQGLSLADLEKTITEQVIMREVVENEVKSKIFVHPKEVTEFYNANPDRFGQPEKAVVDSIFVSNSTSEQETQDTVSEVSRLLKEGKDFLEVASDFSETESLGTVARGQLMPELENVIFSLKINQISEPVEIDTGHLFFRLKEKIPAESSELKDAQSSIQQFLFEKKFQEEFVEWVDKLKKDAYIVIK
ncbi:peptidyl-prolyl cis-trans isomerase [Candidatus Omnitrophota bacterium]